MCPLITGPAVPEEAGSEDDAARDGGVEACFFDGLSGLELVVSGGPEVQPVLEGVDSCADYSSHRDCKLDEASLKGAKAVVRAEGLDDRGEKEKEDSPGEADPEREEDHDWLCEKHFCRSTKGDLQQSQDTGHVDFGFRVDFAARLFSYFLCASFEYYVPSSFAKDRPEDGDHPGIVYYLDVPYPGTFRQYTGTL